MRLVGEHSIVQLAMLVLPKVIGSLLVPRGPRRVDQRFELGEARALLRRERLRFLGSLRQLGLVRLDAVAHPLDRHPELHALDVRVEEVGAADVLAAALQQHLADRLVLVAVGLEPRLDGITAEVVAQVPPVGVGLVEPCHLGVVLALVRGLPGIMFHVILVAEVREADQLARLAQAREVDAQHQVLGVRVLQVGQLLLGGGSRSGSGRSGFRSSPLDGLHAGDSPRIAYSCAQTNLAMAQVWR